MGWTYQPASLTGVIGFVDDSKVNWTSNPTRKVTPCAVAWLLVVPGHVRLVSNRQTRPISNSLADALEQCARAQSRTEFGGAGRNARRGRRDRLGVFEVTEDCRRVLCGMNIDEVQIHERTH